MIRGETVQVVRRVETGRDRFNAPVWDDEVETVTDVLVAPGPRTDVDASTRPDGVRVQWSLHFPKSYTKPLRGCRVAVRGGEPMPVIGDPAPYTMENTPGRWHMPVELGAVHG